jgi:hypothetical protein
MGSGTLHLRGAFFYTVIRISITNELKKALFLPFLLKTLSLTHFFPLVKSPSSLPEFDLGGFTKSFTNPKGAGKMLRVYWRCIGAKNLSCSKDPFHAQKWLKCEGSKLIADKGVQYGTIEYASLIHILIERPLKRRFWGHSGLDGGNYFKDYKQFLKLSLNTTNVFFLDEEMTKYSGFSLVNTHGTFAQLRTL